jgi:hypothetical protein
MTLTMRICFRRASIRTNLNDLDVPVNMQWAAVDIPDPETPVRARGVGEPPVGGGCAALISVRSEMKFSAAHLSTPTPS